jgi:FKBP-type peptidyl-prolyl cis-trans isomerase 2
MKTCTLEGMVSLVIAAGMLILIDPYTGAQAAAHASLQQPDPVQKGDSVTLQVTLRLPDGTLIFTTDPLLAGKEGIKKVSGYIERDCPVPLDIIAGEEGPVPGLKDIVAGMRPGERRTVSLSPEKAFGPIDKNLIKQFDCIKIENRKVTMMPREYIEQFNKFPIKGATVNLNPYFMSKVTKVSEDQAELEHLAKDGMIINGPFGKTSISVKGDKINITLIPTIGAKFDVEGKNGRIVSTDGKIFTVDQNNPLAGKDVVLDAEVLTSIGGSSLKALQIPWMDDYKAGIERGKNEKKPVLLVLYASWCQWSKKYFDETFSDPRIKAMAENFVWVKIDSDLHKEYDTMYQQKGFPFTVLISPDGVVVKKFGGFNDATRLADEIHCTAHDMKGSNTASSAPVLTLPQDQQGCTSGK